MAVNNPTVGWDEKQAYGDKGKLSMADGGTNPGQEKLVKGDPKAKKVDERLHTDKKGKRIPEKVTTKDLDAVRQNSELYESLKQIFKNYAKKLPRAEEDLIKRMMKRLLKSVPI